MIAIMASNSEAAVARSERPLARPEAELLMRGANGSLQYVTVSEAYRRRGRSVSIQVIIGRKKI